MSNSPDFGAPYHGLELPSAWRQMFAEATDFQATHGDVVLRTTEHTSKLVEYLRCLLHISDLFVQGLEEAGTEVTAACRNLTAPARDFRRRYGPVISTGEMSHGMVIHGAGRQARRYDVLAKGSGIIIMLQHQKAGGSTSYHSHNGIEITRPLTYGVDMVDGRKRLHRSNVNDVWLTLPGMAHGSIFMNGYPWQRGVSPLNASLIVAGAGYNDGLETLHPKAAELVESWAEL